MAVASHAAAVAGTLSGLALVSETLAILSEDAGAISGFWATAVAQKAVMTRTPDMKALSSTCTLYNWLAGSAHTEGELP